MGKIVWVLVFTTALLYSAAVTPPPLFVSQGIGATGLAVVYNPAGTPSAMNFGLANTYYGIAVSTDGSKLFALNGNLNTMEMYDATQTPPTLLASVSLSGTVLSSAPNAIAVQQNSITPFPVYVITSAGLGQVTQNPNGTLSYSSPSFSFSTAKCISINGSNSTVLVGASNGDLYIFYPLEPRIFIGEIFSYRLTNIGVSCDSVLSGSGDAAYAIHFNPMKVVPFSMSTGQLQSPAFPDPLTQLHATSGFSFPLSNLDFTYVVCENANHSPSTTFIAGLKLNDASFGATNSTVGSFISALAVDPTLQQLYSVLGSGCIQENDIPNFSTASACILTTSVFSLAMRPPISPSGLLYNLLGGL